MYDVYTQLALQDQLVKQAVYNQLVQNALIKYAQEGAEAAADPSMLAGVRDWLVKILKTRGLPRAGLLGGLGGLAGAGLGGLGTLGISSLGGLDALGISGGREARKQAIRNAIIGALIGAAGGAGLSYSGLF